MAEKTMYAPTCPECSKPAGGVELEAWKKGVNLMCAHCGAIINQEVMLKARKEGADAPDHLSSLEAAKRRIEAERESTPPPLSSSATQPETLPQPAAAFKQELMSLEEAKELWDAFEETKKQLLTGDDVMLIAKKPYIMKSGWRKIATRFRISTELISINPMSRKDPIEYRASVKAINMGGRFTFGVGFCSEDERKDWSSHRQHDIMTMAEVRATNRAIADMVGCAEMSAEEVTALKKVK